MALSEMEQKKFWPVYEAYQMELDKLNERTMNLIKEYAEYFEKRSAKTSIKPWWTLLHLLPVQFSDWT